MRESLTELRVADTQRAPLKAWMSGRERREHGQRTRIVLVSCSPAIVAQINLVHNFTGSGVVKSFYVPYFCPDCDEEKVLLVDASDMGPPPHEPPTCRCDECDLVMDFDDMADSYFAFLSNQKKIAEPDKINGVIKEFAASDANDKSKVRSDGTLGNDWAPWWKARAAEGQSAHQQQGKKIAPTQA